MLYTNLKLRIERRELSFGDLAGVTIGRGRRSLFLPTPIGLEGEIFEFCPDLTIGTTISGRPRINQEQNQDIYLILSSSRQGYASGGRGSIEALRGQDYQVIAHINNADDRADHISTWEAVILKASENTVFRVVWSDLGCEYFPSLYVVNEGKVYETAQEDVEFLYEELDTEMPFQLAYAGLQLTTIEEEWENV